MIAPYSPVAAATVVALVNVPFGYWRASCRRLSVSWFASVHVPVILAIALRISLGIAFMFSNVALFVLAFISGQFLGGWIQRQMRKQH